MDTPIFQGRQLFIASLYLFTIKNIFLKLVYEWIKLQFWKIDIFLF